MNPSFDHGTPNAIGNTKSPATQGGQSALAKLMYVLRQGKYALGRDDLEASDWRHLPEWCDGDPAPLFAAADLHERANARLWVELEGALPVELGLEHCIALTRAMADVVAATGLPFVWGIHAGRPPAPGEPRNRHFHLVFLERINDDIPRDPARWFRRANTKNPAAGGAAKDRRVKGHGWLPNVRRRYEQLVNAALERAGRPERVTAASHRDRIARAVAAGDHETAEHLRRHPPSLHIGPTACAIERGRPGRTEQPTDRGDLARARRAEGARLRADLARFEGELTEHHRAAVAAARDAGVDEELVVAAQTRDPDTVIALVDGTELRRHEIRDAARRLGFDDDLMADIRATAEPDNPELGWTAVVESTEEYVGQVERARGIGLPVDVDALIADARRGGTDPVSHLARVNEIWATARRAGLDNEQLNDIYRGAENRQAGTGWTAIEDATAERVQRKSAAEAAARSVFVDVDVVYGRARGGDEDELHALEEETAKAEPVVAAARAAGFDDAAIGRIRLEAESTEYGSGWAALAQATAERLQRKSVAEDAARRLGLSVEIIYANARQGVDPVAHLERVTAIWGQARGAGLNNEQLNDIYRGAENRQAGTGWTAIEDATAERVQRKSAAEAAAQSVFVDVDVVYGRARGGHEDELHALEEETAKAEPVVAAARAAGFDDAAIGRIRLEAESTEYGSGWAALAQATAERLQRKSVAEDAARRLGLSVEIIYANARQGVDPVAHLERVTAIWGQARGAGLNNEQLNDIYRGAENRQAGTGWTAIEDATAERVQRKSAAEAAARSVFVDVDVVYGRARGGHEDELHALEEETAKAEPVVAAARAAGFDDAAIGRIRLEAESTEYGSGWAALAQATAERLQRKSVAEDAARRLGLSVEIIYANARQGVDPVAHLERVTAIWGQARGAGLNNEQLNDIYRGAENRQAGTGWTAIEDATAERVQRKSAAEAAARSVFVDVDVVYGRARGGHEDELHALEEETAKAEPVVAAARAAGLDDAAIGRIHDEAESTESGSGREALSKATQRLTKKRELRAEEERKRGEWADLTAEVRATSAGAEWLEEERHSRLDTTKRSLTLDEEMIVVKAVKARIEADLARRAADVDGSLRGGELRRRVERRRGGPPRRLAEREETIEAVELRVQAADEAEERLMLMALARDPERPDRRVPFVTNALLDAVPADGDEPFLEDVVWLLQARFAHAEQKGVDRSGFDADDREKSARHRFGSALASAFKWCVLTIRALIWAACHSVLGGRSETGARVQASLEAADAARQSYQRMTHEEALTEDIDPTAVSEEARADGRDEVAAIIEETARRRQVISDAMANDIDVDAVVRAAEARETGSGFSAVEAALKRFQTAEEAARWLDVDVTAFCASARSRGEDPVQALEAETASRTRVRLLADFVGLSFREFRDTYRAAEEQRLDSGYTAIGNECIRKQTRELVRNELPFGYSHAASKGAWVLAVFDEAAADLLREVQDDDFLHSRLSEVLASSPGSDEERQGAERCYHRPEIKLELQRLKAERGWLSSKPTEEDALKAVLEPFIPELADRVRAACDGVADLDRLLARLVEDDWVRRVVTELPQALPREHLEPGSRSGPTAASNERLSRIAATTDDPRVRKILVAYQAHNDYNAPDRQRAETLLLARRRREGEESGQTQAQAEATASTAHDADLLRILQDVCRRVQFREFEEVCLERVRDRMATSTGPGLAYNHGAQKRGPRDHPQGWSW